MFGGYTSKDWSKKNGNYDFHVEDDKAWLFSIDHQTKLKVKQD